MFLSLEVVSYQQVLKTLQFMQGWSLGFVFVVGNDDGDLDELQICVVLDLQIYA